MSYAIREAFYSKSILEHACVAGTFVGVYKINFRASHVLCGLKRRMLFTNKINDILPFRDLHHGFDSLNVPLLLCSSRCCSIVCFLDFIIFFEQLLVTIDNLYFFHHLSIVNNENKNGPSIHNIIQYLQKYQKIYTKSQ